MVTPKAGIGSSSVISCYLCSDWGFGVGQHLGPILDLSYSGGEHPFANSLSSPGCILWENGCTISVARYAGATYLDFISVMSCQKDTDLHTFIQILAKRHIFAPVTDH